jgi:hypothetical protein
MTMLSRLAAVTLGVVCVAATAAEATTGPTARASIGPTAILVAGRPFFPIMLLDQCDAAATLRARTLGVNLVVNENCTHAPARSQLRALQRGQLAVLPIDARSVRGARLAGWTYPDEPENNGWTAATLASRFAYTRGSADGLISFVTTTSGFFRPPYANPKTKRSTIGAIARVADVAGFDLYPINRCQHDLSQVYDAQRAFIDLVGPMPTFQWIETGPLDSKYCGGVTVSAPQITAEAWLAVIGGARAIGFFTQSLSPPAAFSVSRDGRRAIARFAAAAREVRPGLVGTTVASSADSLAVKVLARASADAAYVFAVNSSGYEDARVQIHVPRLRSGRIRVFGEKRTVKVTNHEFVDVLPPFGVHVYVQAR